MPLSKEDIDELLTRAWEAERSGQKLESARLYRQALQELAIFRDQSPRETFEALNCFFFSFFVALIIIMCSFFQLSL
jgi:hypothetical protein